MSRRITSLTIKDKLNLINEYNETKQKRELCKKYECDVSTVNRILKNEAELRSIAAQANTNLKRKRMRKSSHDKVSRALSLWYEANRRRNTLITSAILLNKAEEFAIKFNEDFKPNTSWLWRWRRRENIKFAKIHGKGKNEIAKAEHYVEPVEPDLQDFYNVEDISNVDETGVFYEPCISKENAVNYVEVLTSNNDIKSDTLNYSSNHDSSDNNNTELVLNSNTSDTAHYVETILPDLLKTFKPEDIFNADESCLLYKALPNAVAEPIDEKVSKSRLTLLFLCNATGSYKKIYAIGRIKNLRYYKNTSFPVEYMSDPTALMTSALWANILTKLDEEMILKNRKIILFVDNAPCHSLIVNLKNINVQYLPINTTALTQPLNLGIINSFKSLYREILIKKQMCSLGRAETAKEFFQSISILDAMRFVKRAWESLQIDTIIEAFKKAGLSLAQEHENSILDSVPNSADYVKCDDNFECCLNKDPLSEDGIIEAIKKEISDDEDEVNTEEMANNAVVPTVKEAFMAINVLQKFCSHHNIDNEPLNIIEEKILKIFKKQLRPRQLEFYFKNPIE